MKREVEYLRRRVHGNAWKQRSVPEQMRYILGGTRFGARAHADNLNEERMCGSN